jgi:hypothetical protein
MLCSQRPSPSHPRGTSVEDAPQPRLDPRLELDRKATCNQIRSRSTQELKKNSRYSGADGPGYDASAPTDSIVAQVISMLPFTRVLVLSQVNRRIVGSRSAYFWCLLSSMVVVMFGQELMMMIIQQKIPYTSHVAHVDPHQRI